MRGGRIVSIFWSEEDRWNKYDKQNYQQYNNRYAFFSGESKIVPDYFFPSHRVTFKQIRTCQKAGKAFFNGIFGGVFDGIFFLAVYYKSLPLQSFILAKNILTFQITLN